ncbi:MAG TPA: molybdopterin-dependent oxidoreductase [Gallionella sp.]|nr:molybdopterin-dependent oxidoreductase [Gallionella sp.]
MTLVSSYCPLCISRCGCFYKVENGVLTDAVPNPDHPTGKHLCAKVRAAPALLRHPDRLLHPLRRTNPKGSDDPGWQRISWDEALSTTASNMRRIAAESGAEAVSFCVTTPSGTAVADGMAWIFRLANAFGSPNAVWTTHVCNWHRDFAPALTFGSDIGMPDFARTGCLLLWGVNPSATWLAMAEEIEQARQRGMKLIVIDPREAGFAKRADAWLRVRPGTDGILALALANLLVQNGSYDREFLLRHSTAPFLVREDNGEFLLSAEGQKMVWNEAHGCAISAPPPGSPMPLALTGRFEIAASDNSVFCRPAFDLFAQRCAEYPLARAAEITGIPGDSIAQTAGMMSHHGPVAFYGWAGLNQHHEATQTSRALHLLYALTGCYDAPGGNVFFTKPPVRNMMGSELLPQGQAAKALGLAEHPLGPAGKGWISEADLYRAIVEKKPYPVRGLLSFGSNLPATRPEPQRGMEALRALEFYAHADFFPSAMSRDADILFPVAMPWERQGLQAGFFVNQAAESLVQLRTPIVEPQGEARSDAAIAFALADRLGLSEHFFGSKPEAALRHLLEPTGLTPEALRVAPEGVKLPLDTHYFKYRDKNFATPSRRIEFYSEALQRINQPPLPAFRQPEISAEFPLLMTCAKLPDRCHSQHQQAERPAEHQRRKQRFPAITIHPATAEKTGIVEGDTVTVRSPHGTMLGRAKLDAALHPQTLWAHYGWWQAIPGEAPEMSTNYTSLAGPDCDPVSGSALLRGICCRVEKTGYR